MKKIYIIDLVMLIINIISFAAFIYFIGNISRTELIIYALFLTMQIFISMRLKILMKYTPKSKPSGKEYMYIFLLFLAKIQFILVVFNNTMSLHWSVLHFGILSLFIVDHSYISNDKLIYNLNKTINIKDLKSIEKDDKLFSIIYINGYLKSEKKIKFKLTKEEFEYLEGEISQRNNI